MPTHLLFEYGKIGNESKDITIPHGAFGYMATKLKQYSDEGNLTELAVQLILNEKKTETGKVTLTEKKIRKYFPKEYSREQIEQVIYELLDNWKKSQ